MYECPARGLFKRCITTPLSQYIIMAQSRYVFHVYGDSNSHKFLPIVKAAKTDPAVKNTMYTCVTNAAALKDELSQPSTCHSTIIVSALTNVITSSQFVDYDALKVFSIQSFTDVLMWISEGREFLDGFASRVICHFIVASTSLLHKLLWFNVITITAGESLMLMIPTFCDFCGYERTALIIIIYSIYLTAGESLMFIVPFIYWCGTVLSILVSEQFYLTL